MKKSLFALGLLFVLISWKPSKSFPKMDFNSLQGKQITNDYFKNQKTIVVHFHLGCHAAMVLLRDLQAFQKENSENYQILLIAENTANQVSEFNSTEENLWSNFRTNYKIAPLNFDLIPECQEEKIEIIDGNTVIMQQCRKFAKKLKTKVSPTIFVVNGEGDIETKFKGYLQKGGVDKLKTIING